jgi:hypothetical protein
MLKSSELNNLLSASENGAKIKEAIQSAIPSFRRGLSETGRPAPIDLQDEGQNYPITKYELQNLCNWYLNNVLDEIELEYIASALELSEDFEYEVNIAEELFLLATPEINEPITNELVNNMLKRLQRAA